MYKKAILIIIAIIFISTPFVVIGLFSEESNNLLCYDRNNNLIQGVKCSGIENEIMDNFHPLIFLLFFTGIFLFLYNLLFPIDYKKPKTKN